MRFENLLIVWLCFILLLFNMPVSGQTDGLEKFDPFLQRDLKARDHFELIQRAEPGVPSPELAKVQAEVEQYYNVIFHGNDAALDDLGVRYNTRLDGIATARVTLHDLLKARHHSGIYTIERGGVMTTTLDRSIRRINADRVHDGEILNVPYQGRGVVIGIIDTGLDIFHPDFRDPLDDGFSRVLSMWDVRLDPEGGESHPDGFDYGVEYTRDDINRELRGETQDAIRSKDVNGHGTHVAGIAGGNGEQSFGRFKGVAPKAELVIVSFTDGSFFPAEVVDAMSYIFNKADELGMPAVVNLSIGGHGGAHDGTGGHEQAIAQYSQHSGRAISVAAGNSGANDIHYGSSLAASEVTEFTLQIPSYDPDPSDDDYVFKMLWYESDESIEVTVTSPNGHSASAASGDSVYVVTPDGSIELDTANDFMNQKNARLFIIDIHTAELLDGTPAIVPPASGGWNISVRNVSDATSATFNSWIVSQSMDWPWLDPSTGRDYTVTMPGTSEGAITAGSFVSRNQWTARDGSTYSLVGQPALGSLSSFSGGGPTRDGRIKPDITLPGQIVGSAESGPALDAGNYQSALLLQEPRYVLLQGTSMATPHMAGVAALIFEANPTLTGREIMEIMHESGQSDSNTGNVPNNAWGFGKADAFEMFNFFDPTEGIPDEFYLYQNYPNPFNQVTRIRFTIPEPTYGKLAVYDILGRQVDVIIEGDLEPRVYFESFDGSNFSSGVYFYRLETSIFTEVKRMILLR